MQRWSSKNILTRSQVLVLTRINWQSTRTNLLKVIASEVFWTDLCQNQTDSNFQQNCKRVTQIFRSAQASTTPYRCRNTSRDQSLTQKVSSACLSTKRTLLTLSSPSLSTSISSRLPLESDTTTLNQLRGLLMETRASSSLWPIEERLKAHGKSSRTSFCLHLALTISLTALRGPMMKETSEQDSSNLRWLRRL